jgi:hypothetical protein
LAAETLLNLGSTNLLKTHLKIVQSPHQNADYVPSEDLEAIPDSLKLAGLPHQGSRFFDRRRCYAVGAFRKALHTKRLARSDEPQDDFLTLWTDLRELYRARGQEDDLSDRVSLEKDGLSSPVGALMGERNNSFAVC